MIRAAASTPTSHANLVRACSKITIHICVGIIPFSIWCQTTRSNGRLSFRTPPRRRVSHQVHAWGAWPARPPSLDHCSGNRSSGSWGAARRCLASSVMRRDRMLVVRSWVSAGGRLTDGPSDGADARGYEECCPSATAARRGRVPFFVAARAKRVGRMDANVPACRQPRRPPLRRVLAFHHASVSRPSPPLRSGARQARRSDERQRSSLPTASAAAATKNAGLPPRQRVAAVSLSS